MSEDPYSEFSLGFEKRRHQWIVRYYGKYDIFSGKQKRYSKQFESFKEAEKFIEDRKNGRNQFDNRVCDCRGFFQFLMDGSYDSMICQHGKKSTLSYIEHEYGIISKLCRILIKIKDDDDLRISLTENSLTIEQAMKRLRERGESVSVVYFIQDIRNKRIKIGTSGHGAVERCKLISTATSEPDILEVIGFIDGDYRLEDKIHNQFHAYKVLNKEGNWHGEWFYPAQEILDYIEELKREGKFVSVQSEKK